MVQEAAAEPAGLLTPLATTVAADADLATIRRAFARQMVAFTGGEDVRLEAAFAAVPRENFLGPDAWTLLRPPQAALRLERNDPVLVYQDVLVELDGARGINNGSPSLHALMLSALGVRPGDQVLHVGAGTGYYTAILAELAGSEGVVTAVEFHRGLAAAAVENLRPWRTVTVLRDYGARHPVSDVDRIYVNFGVAHPASRWLDRLSDGGTLVFPLAVPRDGTAPNAGFGAVLRVERLGAEYGVRFVSTCGFVTAEGRLGGIADEREKMATALAKPGIEFVRGLRRGEVSPERCWFWSPEWSLSYDAPEGRTLF